MYRTSAFAAVFVALTSASALAENTASPAGEQLSEWAIDAAHARVGFTVPHMVVSEIDGQFKNFSGKVQLDERDLTHSKLEFSAEVASIDTGLADRDKHLKGPDFFDAEKFPTIQFNSTSIKKSGKGYKITGDLTMRGVTKRVTLDATLSAAVVNPWGKQVRAARITGAIQRQDFGVSWNKSLDKGGVVVGETVSLDVKLELNK
jgi:polyisoprenoid-binding protein YceI